jgi:formiminotetrahydrofolate cyclodeaminase
MTNASAAEQDPRRAAIQEATKLATEVPLETMRVCQQAMRGAVTVARAGNRNAVSDVGVAVELLLTGLRGARLNVDINLPGIKDQEYAARVAAERDMLETDAAHDAHSAREALT